MFLNISTAYSTILTFTSPDCTKTFCYESAYTSRVLSEIKGNTNINIEARYRCLFTVTMYI